MSFLSANLLLLGSATGFSTTGVCEITVKGFASSESYDKNCAPISDFMDLTGLEFEAHCLRNHSLDS